MNRKSNLSFIGLIAALIGMLVLVIGSLANNKEGNVGIYTLKIVAATGNKENPNCVGIVKDSGSPYGKSNQKTLTSTAAMQLIKEINTLPDVMGDETDPFAYKIRMQYYDENGERVLAEKYGYGVFPENWSRIVAYHNKINERDKLTNSTDIVIVDAELLKNEFGVTEDMFPKGVSVEKYLEDTGLTYPDLYDGIFYRDAHIHAYLYDYYDLASHRIKADTAASASDTDALKEYAEANLDRIEKADEISVEGSFRGYDFQIIRFDHFEDWKTERGVDGEITTQDDTINIFYTINCGPEGMTYPEDHYVYKDPTNRFLIISLCDNYEVIHNYFDR